MATNGPGARWRRVAVGVAMATAVSLPGPGVADALPTAGSSAAEPLAIEVAPTTGLADGQFVEVTVTGTVAPVTLAQCDATVGTAPDVGTLLELCSNFLQVADTGRPVTVDYPVVEQMLTSSDVAVACGDAPQDCVVAATGAVGDHFVSVPIEVVPGPPGPLSIRISEDTVSTWTRGIGVQVWGGRPAPVGVAVCGADVATVGDVHTGPCLPPSEVAAGRVPTMAVVDAVREFTGADGTAVECDAAPGACVVAASARGGGPLVTVPLTFTGDVDVVLSPTAGLLDGEAMDVEVTGLAPDSVHRVVRCMALNQVAVDCEYPLGAPALTASPAGTLSTTIAASSTLRVTAAWGYCRLDCAVGVFADGVPYTPVGVAPYTMATGALDASPDSGLVDGQVVELTASDVMSSYTGPPYWFFQTTGQWVVGQCARDVLDGAAAIYSVFAHCTPVPEGGDVDVPGSTLDTDVTVRAEIAPLLGGTVDCTTAPGACALVLTRFEQDGSVSLHGAELTFG